MRMPVVEQSEERAAKASPRRCSGLIPVITSSSVPSVPLPASNTCMEPAARGRGAVALGEGEGERRAARRLHHDPVDVEEFCARVDGLGVGDGARLGRVLGGDSLARPRLRDDRRL